MILLTRCKKGSSTSGLHHFISGNGVSAPTTLPLAIRLACREGGRMAHKESWKLDLRKATDRQQPMRFPTSLRTRVIARVCHVGWHDMPRLSQHPSRAHATSDTTRHAVPTVIAACRRSLVTHYACAIVSYKVANHATALVQWARGAAPGLACTVCLGTSCDAVHDTRDAPHLSATSFWIAKGHPLTWTAVTFLHMWREYRLQSGRVQRCMHAWYVRATCTATTLHICFKRDLLQGPGCQDMYDLLHTLVLC